MKKFLSSLLALTMILSLVIVPAQADTVTSDDGYSISFVKSSIDKTGGNADAAETTIASVKLPSGVTPASYSWESKDTSKATVQMDSTDNSKATVTAVAKGSAQIVCTVSLQSGSGMKKAAAEITVTDAKADAQKAFEDSITHVKYEDRSYEINKTSGTWTATVKYLGSTAPTTGFSTNVSGVTATLTGSTLTLTKGANSKELTLTLTPVALTAPSITATGVTSNTIREGEKGVLTADYTSALGTADADLTYEWYNGTNKIARSDSKTLKLDDKLTFPASNTPYSITVKVKDNGVTKESAPYSLTVNADTHRVLPDYPYTTMATGESQFLKLTVKDGTETNTNPTLSTVWSVENGKNSYISLSDKTNKQATATAGSTSGRVTVTAVVTYLNKDYTVEFPIKIEALDDTIASVTNGDSNSYDDSELESLVTKIIKKKDSRFRRSRLRRPPAPCLSSTTEIRSLLPTSIPRATPSPICISALRPVTSVRILSSSRFTPPRTA